MVSRSFTAWAHFELDTPRDQYIAVLLAPEPQHEAIINEERILERWSRTKRSLQRRSSLDDLPKAEAPARNKESSASIDFMVDVFAFFSVNSRATSLAAALALY